MNPNRPNVSSRDAESTDDIFIWHFTCKISKEVATKLPISKFQFSAMAPQVTI